MVKKKDRVQKSLTQTQNMMKCSKLQSWKFICPARKSLHTVSRFGPCSEWSCWVCPDTVRCDAHFDRRRRQHVERGGAECVSSCRCHSRYGLRGTRVGGKRQTQVRPRICGGFSSRHQHLRRFRLRHKPCEWRWTARDPTIADSSGSDSDAPLVSRGRFAALSDDMTVLVEACSGSVDNCSRFAIPIGEENRNRRLRLSQGMTVVVPPETLQVTVQPCRGVQPDVPRRPSRRLILVRVEHRQCHVVWRRRLCRFHCQW